MEMGIFEVVKAAYRTSDSCGKLVVFLLIAASAVVWSIMVQKVIQVMTVSRQCRRYKRAFLACKGSPLEMIQRFGSSDIACGPIHAICEAGIRDLLAILGIRDFEQREFFRHGSLPRKLSGDEIDKIQATMNRIVTSQSISLEENLTMLSTLVSISPLLGLFGTVWGVMVTFIGIAQVGRPDIATIAPGISGALLTTVCGLLVAIPTLFCNNLILRTVENIYTDMDNFVNDFISSLRLEEIRPVVAESSRPAMPVSPAAPNYAASALSTQAQSAAAMGARSVTGNTVPPRQSQSFGFGQEQMTGQYASPTRQQTFVLQDEEDAQ